MNIKQIEGLEFRCSTDEEIVSDWVWRIGAQNKEQAWILSPYDTWETNPHYKGPKVPHPEYDDELYNSHYSEVEDQVFNGPMFAKVHKEVAVEEEDYCPF